MSNKTIKSRVDLSGHGGPIHELMALQTSSMFLRRHLLSACTTNAPPCHSYTDDGVLRGTITQTTEERVGEKCISF